MEITALIDFLDSIFAPWGYQQKKPLIWYKKYTEEVTGNVTENVILLKKRKHYKNAYQFKSHPFRLSSWSGEEPVDLNVPVEELSKLMGKIKFATKEKEKAYLQLLNLNKKMPDTTRTAQLRPFIQDYVLYNVEPRQMRMTRTGWVEFFIDLFTAHGYSAVLSPQASQANPAKVTPAMLHVRHEKGAVDYTYYFTHIGDVFTKTIALILAERSDIMHYILIHYYFTIRGLPLHGKHAHVYCHFELPAALDEKLIHKCKNPFYSEGHYLHRHERKELLTELTTTYFLKPLAEINSVEALLAHMQAKDIYVPWMIKEKYPLLSQ